MRRYKKTVKKTVVTRRVSLGGTCGPFNTQDIQAIVFGSEFKPYRPVPFHDGSLELHSAYRWYFH